MASVKIKETMEDWYSVERDFIAVITDLTKQVSIIEYEQCNTFLYCCIFLQKDEQFVNAHL